MNFKILLSIKFLFISTIVLAQTNFKKAIIVKENSDTLNGYIDYREWIKSPEEIAFKKDINSNIQYLNKENTNSFKILANDETFENLSFSYEKIARSGDISKFISLNNYAQRNKEMVTKTAFVRQISKGILTLYSFGDEKQEYYLIKKEAEIIPLEYHIVEIGDKMAFFKIFQNQLENLLFENCKNRNYKNVDYDEKSLKNVIDEYNSCFEPSKTPKISSSKKRFIEVGVLGGYYYSNLKTTYANATATVFTTVNGNWDSFYKGGIYFNVVFPRKMGRFALENEFHNFRTKNAFLYDLRKFIYNLDYIGMNNLIRVKLKINNPTIYILGGLSNSYAYHTNCYKIDYDGAIIKYTGDKFRKDEQGFIGGLGLGYNGLRLETRITGANGISTAPLLKSPSTRIDFVMKFDILK